MYVYTFVFLFECACVSCHLWSICLCYSCRHNNVHIIPQTRARAYNSIINTANTIFTNRRALHRRHRCSSLRNQCHDTTQSVWKLVRVNVCLEVLRRLCVSVSLYLRVCVCVCMHSCMCAHVCDHVCTRARARGCLCHACECGRCVCCVCDGGVYMCAYAETERTRVCLHE